MDFISNTSGLRMVVASWLDKIDRGEEDMDPLCVTIIPIVAWAVDKREFGHQAEPVVPPEYAEFLPRYERCWSISAYIDASGNIYAAGGAAWNVSFSLSEWVEQARRAGAAREAK